MRQTKKQLQDEIEKLRKKERQLRFDVKILEAGSAAKQAQIDHLFRSLKTEVLSKC